MSAEEMALADRVIRLWIAGERDEAWSHWSEDCVGIPNRDWPEPGPWRGREELRAVFQSWDSAFGDDWTNHLEVRQMSDLGEGRVLIELEFKTSGLESGLPVDQELAVIQSIEGGEIVRAEFFMDWGESRRAAGLE